MVVPLKGGKPRNAIAEESFRKINDDIFKDARVACKYCQKELDKNTSRLQNHLDVCKSYQEAVKLGQTPGALHAPKIGLSSKSLLSFVPVYKKELSIEQERPRRCI